MNIIYHSIFTEYIIIYCTILLYIESETKEKEVRDLKLFLKIKEGITSTIVITNILHVTYLSIVMYTL